jgi:cyclophilin family peptidyl-prolyl cis-trans isomerase
VLGERCFGYSQTFDLLIEMLTLLNRFHLCTLKVVVVATSVLALLGCGGSTTTGFPPVVTAFKAQTVQYSRPAVIYIGGNDLRSNLTVESGGACTNPSFAASSTTSLMILNCTVVKVGDMPVTVKDANGNVLYQTTLNVPKPQVTLGTSSGDITLELDPTAAPVTVNNFLSYVHSGYYSSTLFHRVMPGFVIQGGGYTTGLTKKAGQSASITLESNKGLSNQRGTIAMARLGDDPNDPVGSANSATSEFFINLVDNTYLDYKTAKAPGYAVFGTVLQGMTVVDTIATQPTGPVGLAENVPLTDVTITSATQIK